MPNLTKNRKTPREKKFPDKYNDFIMDNRLSKNPPKKEPDNTRKTKSALSHDHRMFSPSNIKKTRHRVSLNKPIVDIASVIKSLGIDNMSAKDYIHSSIDNHQMVSVKKVTVLKKFQGRGLFAEKDIPTGTLLGQYTGKLFTIKKFEKYLKSKSNVDDSYAMTLNNSIVDAQKEGNFTRYINFSDSHSNVQFEEGTLASKTIVEVVTIKDIKLGQQILVDYNTFEKQKSSEYYFLNPEDGFQTAQELYQCHQNFYQSITLQNNYKLLGLEQNDKIYVTKVGQALFQKELISDLDEMLDKKDFILPCLKMDKSLHILDFNETDTYTPIMVASYLGQHHNVKTLIDNDVNINQQQNQSGNCPLFFALEGYASVKRGTTAYVNILKELIINNANLSVHDRQDRTFLHKAILTLSDDDFKLVLKEVKRSLQNDVSHLFAYIDEMENDIIVSCIHNKMFKKFKKLLSLYPDYFKNGYEGDDEYINQFNKNSFTNALENYSDDEKSNLLHFINTYKLKISPALLHQLGLEERTTQLKL